MSIRTKSDGECRVPLTSVRPANLMKAGNLSVDKTSMPQLRILLAEDSPVSQEVVLMMLAELGYAADIATNGVEAVAAFRREPYDVVLMDARMPEMGGTQAALQIRAVTGSSLVPWIVAMTADAGDSDREEYLSAGMNDFLEKPVCQDALEAALSRVPNHRAGTAVDEDASRTVNASVLLNLTRGDREKLRSLCHAYLDDAYATLGELDRLAAADNFESLRQKVHYLKGSSSVVGAMRVVSLCRQAEARAVSHEPLALVLNELRHACQATAAVFAQFQDAAGDKKC